jgi:hypothetical protein
MLIFGAIRADSPRYMIHHVAGYVTYSYMLVIYNRNISRRVLAAEMLLPIHTSHISCHPDIILSRHEIGLTYRRETYTNLSARTVGAA